MNAQQSALFWANHSCFDLATRQEAKRISEDEQKALRCFGSELSFGTGGLRGVVGVGTACMNRYTVAKATTGLARWLLAHSKAPAVVIAHDSRHGSEAFTDAAAQVLCAHGVAVHVFPELAPTPMLSYAVRTLKCEAGIMITASHNPAVYNGYKVYGADGCQITDEAAAEITAQIEKVSYEALTFAKEAEARREGLWLTVGDEIACGFAQACLFCRPDPELFEPVHVVYTPLYGTGLAPVREVLRHMQGVAVTEVAEQCAPDGDFPTCPKPNPELDSALKLGIDCLKTEQADLLLATDPDCDRVGVVVRDGAGQCHRLSGNEVGLLLSEYILKTRRDAGTLPARPLLIKTIVTSDLLFPIAKAYGAEVREVLTGFKYIGEMIGRLEKSHQESRFVFGFEESCGYLAGVHVRDKDGVMACMLVCEMAQACRAKGLTLWDALTALYARYGYMENALLNFDIVSALPMEEMAAKMKALREQPVTELAGSPVTQVRDYAPGIEGLPASNVLSYFTADGLKAIVRPSGTEPKVKVYLSARGETAEIAAAKVSRMREEIEKLLA